MKNKSQHGYLLLADISGFVAYLAAVELDHAQAILQELFELIAHQLASVLVVSRQYGGAVPAYAPAESLPRGETLLEVIEATYSAFRRRLAHIRRNTTCNCKACSAVPDLELNFLVHFGGFLVGRVAGQETLVGLDVDLISKRLLKDQLKPGETGQGYAIFTLASLSQLGIDADSMQAESGVYPFLGDIPTYRLDLRARHQAEAARKIVQVSAEQSVATLTGEFNVAPAELWRWLNDPRLRSRWTRGRRWSSALRPGGRTGVGASNHCEHGIGRAAETVLDWKPFDYFTIELMADGGLLILEQTYRLQVLPGARGTRLQIDTRVKKGLPQWLARPLCTMTFTPLLRSDLERLGRVIAEESSAQSVA